jgi:predicted homoserine dehydrogenase-like protein
MLYKILNELKKKESAGEIINIGLVGCGQMGSGMVNITHQSPGMEITAIADLEVERGINTFIETGYARDQIKVCERVNEAQRALEEGKVVVTSDACLLAKVPAIEAVIEATGSTEVGSKVAFSGILESKHVIMLNVETDVTVGWVLKKMADQAGVVYTTSAGDEPGALMELYRFARLMGFKIVTIGKGKNNPVNHYATPEMLEKEALSKHMNPKMLCAFVDGTKTMVEMAEVSNATGAEPDIPGMHGAKVDVAELSTTYISKRDGGIFEKDYVVDYSTGKVAPGVFVIITTDSEHLRNDLRFYSMGEGPYYTLYRPYHLCSFETPISVARACITGEPTINSLEMNSEVVTVAKRDLFIEDKLDGFGGYDFYGKTYSYKESCALNALPVGIAEGAVVKREIKKGEVITYNDVDLEKKSFVVKLRGIQDNLLK